MSISAEPNNSGKRLRKLNGMTAFRFNRHSSCTNSTSLPASGVRRGTGCGKQRSFTDNKSVNRSWLAFPFFNVDCFVYNSRFTNAIFRWSANPVISNVIRLISLWLP